MNEEQIAKLFAALAELNEKVDRLVALKPKQKPMTLGNTKVTAENGRFTLLKGKLILGFQKARGVPYVFTPDDAWGISHLLKLALNFDAITQRWTYAVKERGCGSIAQFAKGLNSYTPQTGKAPKEVTVSDDPYRETPP